jgi:hypothetical protein
MGRATADEPRITLKGPVAVNKYERKDRAAFPVARAN